jgi:hypothetical protein
VNLQIDFGTLQGPVRMGCFLRGSRSAYRCTDDLLALDVRKLARAGALTPGRRYWWEWRQGASPAGGVCLDVGASHVDFSYRPRTADGGDEGLIKFAVPLEWTACHLGGRRAWWLCPEAACGRRVAVLFGGRRFACRRCQLLTYRSQREAQGDRATRVANKLRARLGWRPGILNGTGGKPKGMHWRTFWRLQGEYEEHAQTVLAGIVAQMGWVQQRVAAFDKGRAG